MNSPSRFGTAVSMLALATVLTGCAAGEAKRESIFGSKVDHSNIGLATRAQASLASGDLAGAVQLAERAVENTPTDAGFRSLLGNAYFASGRFASAEAAYRDSLTLFPSQPQLVLKLALVQIAQGKNMEALSLLEATRDALEPADYGLAVALAGRPADAVAVLNQAARQAGADARTRQNLALAYGLSGDWTMARTIAAQDVPPEQLDSRIQQWMAMSTPTRASDQIAALTGVTPSVDPGQPVRLALNVAPSDQRQAAVIPQVQPQQVEPQPQPQQVAAFVPAPPPAMPEPMPQPQVAEAAPAPAPVIAEASPPAQPIVDEPDPVVASAVQSLIEPVPAPAADVTLAAAPAAPPVEAAAPPLPTSFDEAVEPASYVPITSKVRRAAAIARPGNGKSKSVMQLGAYSSPDRVTVAWNLITKRYPALRDYTPVRARFDGPKGTVWRLSVKGFDSQQEAVDRCELLQSRGGKCFVRRVAGDAPVQLASR